MMIAFGAIFALQITKYFNDIFRDGVRGLEQNVGRDTATGQGFGGSN